MRLSVIGQVAVTALREYLRTPEAIFWTYGFPLVMAVVLGIAFSSSEPGAVRVVIPQSSQGAFADLLAKDNGRVQIEVRDADAAERALSMGEFDLLLQGSREDPSLRIDPRRPGSELARFHLERLLAGEPETAGPRIEAVTEPGARYIDFLIPGLIGLNLLGAGMFGVGGNLVHLRTRHLLRRLTVTPMRRSEFLLGFVSSRVLLSLPAPFVIILFGWVGFGVPMRGSILTVFLLTFLGALSFSGLGLLVASRIKTIEGLSGMANLVMMPMWLLGGSFFSNERFPDVLQPLVQAMPLTHLNDAYRDVMLGGASLASTLMPMAILFLLGLICFLIALRIFRWN
ncbi:MAG: ABC transporter permease [Planctomycetota bacterium]|jgi:ABC-type multidrug transport system permease subunit